MALGLDFGTGTAGDGESLLSAFTKINTFLSTTTKLTSGDLEVNGVIVGTGNNSNFGSTALGYLALNSNLATGHDNTAIGWSALSSNTSGDYNTAIGSNAMRFANTSGNTAVGITALKYSIGIDNTAVGINGLTNNSDGTSNTAIGAYAMEKNTSGDGNTAVGGGALYNAVSLNYNTAVGNDALNLNTLYSNCTGIGYGANVTASNQVVIGNTSVTSTILRGEVTADKDATFNGVKVGRGANNITSNTAVGNATLTSNTTGTYNSAFGLGSLLNNQGGSRNAAFGGDSLFYNISGSFNTAIGNSTLVNTTGSENTGVGYGAGQANTSFSNTTCLGANTQVTDSDQIQLGNASTTPYAYQALSLRSDERDKAEVRNTVLGLDFINELRPVDYKWDMREDYKTEMPIKPELPAQELPIKELPIQGELSDEDYQEILGQYNLDYQELLDQSNADYQEIVDQNNADFKIVMDEWLESVKLDNITHDGTHTRTRYHHGLIAQEVQDVIQASGVDFGGFQDHSVNGGQDVLSLGYDELIAPMIKAIQELTARINVLEGN
jgi:hypothetical protein